MLQSRECSRRLPDLPLEGVRDLLRRAEQTLEDFHFQPFADEYY